MNDIFNIALYDDRIIGVEKAINPSQCNSSVEIYKNISEKEYACTFKYKRLFIRLEIESNFIIKYLAFSQSKNYFIKSKSNAFSNLDRFNHLFPNKYTDKNGYFSSYSKYHNLYIKLIKSVYVCLYMYYWYISVSLNLKSNPYIRCIAQNIVDYPLRKSRGNLSQLVCRFYPVLSGLSPARWNSLLLL